eukprot:Hpha_TRINITY_DN16082_c0_g1::TRINITY_DN16082_c0_g1_i1::g.120148::m.120148
MFRSAAVLLRSADAAVSSRLSRGLRGAEDLSAARKFVRGEEASIETLLRHYDPHGQGRLAEAELRGGLEAFVPAGVKVEDTIQALNFEGDGRVPVSEVIRVLRCQLAVPRAGQKQAGDPVAQAARNLMLGVYAADTSEGCMDAKGRWLVVRDSADRVDALIRAFSTDPSGALTPNQAVSYFHSLLKAEAATRSAGLDFRAPKEWASHLEVSEGGVHTLGEVRRVTRMLLFTMPRSVTTDATVTHREEAASGAAVAVFRELRAAGGEVRDRRAVLQHERRTLHAVAAAYDRDADGTLTASEAVQCLTVWLSAEAAARATPPAEPFTSGGRRLLRHLHSSDGLYTCAEVERVAVSELLMTDRGVPKAESPVLVDSEGDAWERAAVRLFRAVHARSGPHGRREVLQREAKTIDVLLRRCDTDQDGILNAEEATETLAHLIAASEAAILEAPLKLTSSHRQAADDVLASCAEDAQRVPVSELRRILLAEVCATGAISPESSYGVPTAREETLASGLPDRRDEPRAAHA